MLTNAARLAGFDQVSDHPLHQEKWAARIGRNLRSQSSRTGVQQRAAVSEGGRIHESIDVAKALQSCVYEAIAVFGG